MSISAERLLDVARLYWRTDKTYDFADVRSPEQNRLSERWRQELARLDRWWAFLDALEIALPAFKIGDATATPDACFRCVAYSIGADGRRFAVVGCVSILAPVHAVYCLQYEASVGSRAMPHVVLGTPPTEMRIVADIVAGRIEDVFETTALPSDIAATRIPLIVHDREPPQTTLFDAILTNQPENIP